MKVTLRVDIYILNKEKPLDNDSIQLLNESYKRSIFTV